VKFVERLIGERIAGRYVVDGVLGTGATAVVASARDPELDERVAIKLLLPMHARNPVHNERFLREAQIAARVRSPHFVRVFDLGKLDTGEPYFVMERLSGRDLGAELAARGKLGVEEAVDFVVQACAGVAELHALGVVHRDLKPANLFIEDADGARQLKVLDFGVSKNQMLEGGVLTSTNHMLGTPHYMSPEQIRDSKGVDARSDVWSLGVVLYELVTGKRPFDVGDRGVGELFAMVLYLDPPSASRGGALPAGLSAVIERCLRRDANERFAGALALAEALRPFASSR
jgi:serine/threonine-protein kinase